MDVPKEAPAGRGDLGVAVKEVNPRPRGRRSGVTLHVQKVPVVKIRPEDGLGRKRDRDGHRELRQSIEQFGVLTPVTVRRAPDDSGDYLLIKGQGRTLACRMLGIKNIPAIVVDDDFAENAKVQQFLVENVARLRMRPVDRALLIARARQDGEETADVAKRFGVSPATVRRLEAQLDGASSGEVAALKQGTVNLTLHAIIARYVGPEERSDAVTAIARYSPKSKELEALFEALGWRKLVELGLAHRAQRLQLLTWACAKLSTLPPGPIADRLNHLAAELPMDFGGKQKPKAVTR
jgi:ParB/RepB/Spo0J family partition protein